MKKRIIAAVTAACMMAASMTGCTEAERATYNVQKEADYVQLAACILRLAFDRYRRILCRCARGDATEAEVQAIEHELCTPYYAALSLHRVDLPALCKEMREEAGLPELEESE